MTARAVLWGQAEGREPYCTLQPFCLQFCFATGLQARDHAMSSTLLREHSLVAFVLHQDDPGCVMLSAPQLPTSGQAATGPVTHGMTEVFLHRLCNIS